MEIFSSDEKYPVIELSEEEQSRVLECVAGRAEYIELMSEGERLDAYLKFYRWLYENGRLTEEL